MERLSKKTDFIQKRRKSHTNIGREKNTNGETLDLGFSEWAIGGEIEKTKFERALMEKEAQKNPERT